MPSRSDATPTYRGYRKQLLYTLYRILQPDHGQFIFVPEGHEDLAIFNKEELVEVVQVKDHNHPLTISDFISAPVGSNQQATSSFFQRVFQLLDTHPALHISIASYGPLGPELTRIIEGDEATRKKAARKLEQSGQLSYPDTLRLFQHLYNKQLDEEEIRQQVNLTLHQTCASAGIDSAPAFELLMYWLYICAENITEVTVAALMERLTTIGRFLAAQREHHRNWYTVIDPIREETIASEEREILTDQFYRGIAARYEHIVADLDVPRSSQLTRIAEKTKVSRVVVIHGPSGQGKSTLAYRYLHDYVPEQWRFQIKHIADQAHALEVALALTEHAHAIGIPLVIYYDVRPTETVWVELIREIANDNLIRIIVTIREEDWKRTALPQTDFQWEDISLDLDKREAEEIYHSLVAQHRPAHLLTFEDAWGRFQDEWPLMEFIYLVTQGESLRERLAAQIHRLREELRRGERPQAELALLRMVSIASAYEARVHTKPLCIYLQLADPAQTITLFEKEYLLQSSDNGSLLQGLHPVRSAIIAALLTDPDFAPWGESAAACLPFMHEPDLEAFLLYTFSLHAGEEDLLLQALMAYQPMTWQAIAGVTRALLWRGLRDYAFENRTVIAEVMAISGAGWWFMLDGDVSQLVPGDECEQYRTLAEFIPPERREILEQLRARQTDKDNVKIVARTWLNARSITPSSPTTDVEWQNLAETLFWLGDLRVSWPLRDWFAPIDFANAVKALPLTIVSELATGIYTGFPDGHQEWFAIYRPIIIERFRHETNTITLEDDGEKVTAHFIVEMDLLLSGPQPKDESIARTNDFFHDEARKRFEFLRYLFPDRALYACQGYGHRGLPTGYALPYDSTLKTGIPKQNLPLRWLPALNRTFYGLVEYVNRPANWQEYTVKMIHLRRQVFEIITRMVDSLAQFFAGHKDISLYESMIKTTPLEDLQRTLFRDVALPQVAVDEWGFVDETTGTPSSIESNGNKWLLQKTAPITRLYYPYIKTWQAFEQPLFRFLTQIETPLLLGSPLSQRGTDPARRKAFLAQVQEQNIPTDSIHLSRINLADAVHALPGFQAAFRKLVGQLADSTDLTVIERNEHEAFERLWALWYQFTEHPARLMPSAKTRAVTLVQNALDLVLEGLLKRNIFPANTGLKLKIVSEAIRWQDDTALWLTIDGHDPVEVIKSIDYLIPIVRKYLQTGSDTTLVQEAAMLYWRRIVVIPMIYGKALALQAWCLHTSTLVYGEQTDLTNWSKAQQRIPSETLDSLALQCWDGPAYESPRRFFEAAVQLLLLVGHVRDLLSLPTEDQQALDYVQQYMAHVCNSISTVLQTVLDTLSLLLNEFNALTPEQLEERKFLLQAVLCVREIAPNLRPQSAITEIFSIQLAEFEAWFAALESSQGYELVIYLYWMTDAITRLTE